MGGLFDLDSKRERIIYLDNLSKSEEFWKNTDASLIMQELSELNKIVDNYDLLTLTLEEATESDLNLLESEIKLLKKAKGKITHGSLIS